MTASAASPVGLSLRLLGAFELRDGAGAVVLAAGKPLALLAYLACARGQRASRQALVELLWGDVDPERGRASLRQALFALRQRLGVELIVPDGEWLSIQLTVSIDARAFFDAVERGHHAQAIDLYAGDFVPEFAAPGAGEFEHWAEMERRRLRGAFLASARTHIRTLLTGGEAMQAVELSGRLRDADPQDDEHWRLRFEALALAGRFPVIDLEEGALRAERSDDGRAVDSATEAILRRVRRAASDARDTGAPSPVSSRIPPDPEFQGRAEVFAQALAAWGLAGRGRAQRRRIVAGAGFGKTRLLRELARRLAAQRARVLHVNARQGERDDAFGYLAEIVTRVAELSGASGIAPSSASVLAGLVPVLADSFNVKPERETQDAGELLRRRSLAFADLLGAVAEDRPLALLLDDLQWADAASMAALDRAFARVPRVPLLLVTASRLDQTGTGADEERLPLPPLSRDEVAMLISSIAVAEPLAWSDALTTRIHAAAGGSPFAVLQFLRLAIERGVILVSADHWEVPDETAVSPLLDRSATVEWRLRLLNETDLETLVCLSLGGPPLSETLLARVAAREAARLREALFRLEGDAFITRAGNDAWRVAHDLVAEAALAIADAELRRQYAGRLAGVLGESVERADVAAAVRVIRLHLDAGTPDAALLFLGAWLAQQPPGASAPSHLAALLVDGPHDPAFAARVHRVLRARRRWWRSRLVVASASVLVTVAVVVFALLRPVALEVTSNPDPTETDRFDMIYEVPPRVELRNALGLVSTWRDGDTVRMMPADAAGPLRGRPAAVLSGGVAVFDSVYPNTDAAGAGATGVSDVRFTLPGVRARVLRRRNRVDSLALVETTLNGRRSLERTPVVRVRPGEPIRGAVQVRYTTRGRDILYAMAQATTWGAGVRDTVTVRTLLAGVAGATFSFPLSLRAPESPGDYWILWTHGAEPSGVWLLSGTNWGCKKPAWGDGNDLPVQPHRVLAEGVRVGALTLPIKLCGAGETTTPRHFPLAGIQVVVR